MSLILTICATAQSPRCRAADQRQSFTVADEIGLRLFDDPIGLPGEIQFSPDGEYFAVWTERGRLDANRVEDSLRFYRVRDARAFIADQDSSKPPAPLWEFSLSTDKEGPIIGSVRWLADSNGVAFIQRAS